MMFKDDLRALKAKMESACNNAKGELEANELNINQFIEEMLDLVSEIDEMLDDK